MKPLPFDSLVLHAVCLEMQAAVGSSVRKVRASGEHEIFLHLKGPEFEGAVTLSSHPRFFRVHLSAKRSGDVADTRFSRILKERVEGGRLLDVSQNGFDRVLRFVIGKADGVYMIAAHLTGTHANSFLVDPKKTVVACARNVGKLRPPMKYEAPPPPANSLEEAIETGRGLSAFLRAQLELLGSSDFLTRYHRGPAVLVPGRGAYPFAPVGVEGCKPFASVGDAIEQFALIQTPADALDSMKHEMHGQLQRALEAREFVIQELTQVLDTAARARELQMRGELILAHMHSVSEGVSDFTVPDYEGEIIKIVIRPDLSLKENAERYFEKAKKAKSGAREVRGALDIKLRECLEIRQACADLELADHTAAALIRETALRKGWFRERTRVDDGLPGPKPFDGHRVRIVEAPGGYQLLYGENATANDYLTTKVAKPNDYWFHVRGHTGSHVVLKTGNRPERVQKPTLEYAATLAARQSTQKHSRHVPVDYVLAKYVRKPRKAAAGVATYQNEKTLFVDP